MFAHATKATKVLIPWYHRLSCLRSSKPFHFISFVALEMKAKDDETLVIVVNAELLKLCEVGNYIKTPKRRYKHLSWWLHVYPNGDSLANEGYLGVSILTSVGGFDVKYCLTVDGTNAKLDEKKACNDKPLKLDFPQLVNHKELRHGEAIQDDELTIHCKIKFTRRTSRTTNEFNIVKESCIIELNQNDIGTIKPNQTVFTDKQVMDGTTWYFDVFPFGYREDNDGYVSMFLNLEGEPKTLEISYALSVCGLLIYKMFTYIFPGKIGKLDFTKLLSHKLCKRADSENGVIELVCIVAFNQNVPSNLRKLASNYSHRTDLLKEMPSSDSDSSSDDDLVKNFFTRCFNTIEWKDNENLVVNADLLSLEPGYFFETSKKPTPCKDTSWWIRYYPNGRCFEEKNNIGVFVYIDGIELCPMHYTFTLDRSGVKEQRHTFFRIKDDPLNHGSPKFISHKQIHDEELVHDDTIVIRCHVNFDFFGEGKKMEVYGEETKDRYYEERSIIKLDRKKFESCEWTLEDNVCEKGGNGSIRWSIECRPYSDTDGKKFISVCFQIYGILRKLETSCAMSIGGGLLQKSDFPEIGNGYKYTSTFTNLYSHNQCLLADEVDGIIELVCTIKYSNLVTYISPNFENPSNYNISDFDLLAVNTDWLDLFESGDACSTPPRPVAGCKNLFWWMQCYLNVLYETQRCVDIHINISAGGFHMTYLILDSPVTKFIEKSNNQTVSTRIFHNALYDNANTDERLFIGCLAEFKIPKETVDIMNKLETFEDIHVVKFNRKLIETYKPGQKITEERQTKDDITWWIEYYPCGYNENESGYASVFFHVMGCPMRISIFSAISIGGVPIVKSSIDTSLDCGFLNCFSHKLWKLADHADGIVDLVCKIQFILPSEPLFTLASNVPTDAPAMDSYTTEFHEDQLKRNDFDQLDSTPRQVFNNDFKYQWKLICFPAGDTPEAKGHIKVVIEVTDSTRDFLLCGVIKIFGTNFNKKIELNVPKRSKATFSALVSHKKLQRIGGIIDGKIRITVETVAYNMYPSDSDD